MKKNTILQLVAGIFLFGTTACTSNFEDYNKNPHEPDTEDMGADLYLVKALVLNLQDLMMPENENFAQYVECLMAGNLGGYAADSNLGTGWSGRYATFNPSEAWQAIPFNDFMKILSYLFQPDFSESRRVVLEFGGIVSNCRYVARYRHIWSYPLF